MPNKYAGLCHVVAIDQLLRRPRENMPRRRSTLLLLAVLLLAPLVVIRTKTVARQIANSAPGGGYRLGNFIEFWILRELLRADAAVEERQLCNWFTCRSWRLLAWWDWRSRHGQCGAKADSVSLSSGLTVADARMLSLVLGARAIEGSGTLQEALYELPASFSPALLHRKSVQTILEPLKRRPSCYYIGFDDAFALLLAGEVRSALRGGLVAASARRPRPASDTCVIHYRIGDASLMEEGSIDLVNAALVAAARGFAPPPARFVMLGGGATHGCVDAAQKRVGCGRLAHARLSDALSVAFPAASVQRSPSASPDDDFAMLLGARMALLTAGTYGLFGALLAANGAEVRVPSCDISQHPGKTDSGRGGACFPMHLLHGGPLRNWSTYAHPLCPARCHLDVGPAPNRQTRLAKMPQMNRTYSPWTNTTRRL